MSTNDHMNEITALVRECCRMRMPFGKFGPGKTCKEGVPLCDLPYEYLAWFARKGFPKGKLGQLLQFVYQLKQDGADAAFDAFRTAPRTSLRKPKGPRTRSFQ